VRITRQILCFFICCLISFSCVDDKKQYNAISNKNISKIIDTVSIVHATLPVIVSVKGYLEFWKKKTLTSSDTSQIISVLVEEGQQVERNDYLLSLWQLKKNKEFTPVDIRAPFPGIIENVNIRVGSIIGMNKPLLHIYNDNFFSVKISMHKDQIRFLKKNQKVISGLQELNLEGFVASVNRRLNIVNILLKNINHINPDRGMVKLDIICGNVRGDFILSKNFKNDKIIAYIDDESTFEISRIGISDSLSLISPRLPHLSKLSVVSHNY